MISVLRKARSLEVPHLDCRGAELPGWFDVLQKNSARDVMCEQARCRDEAASHQLLRASAFWNIRIVSVEECPSLMQNLIQSHCSTHSVILNVKPTQDTCSLNGVYCLQWPVQWSRHCSHMHIPVHSPWLSDYIANLSLYVNNGWTFFRTDLI